MKNVIVPSQITTVEDRITTNLTLQQLLILITPVFINFAIFAILPAAFKLHAYKLILMTTLTNICCLSAVRVKGKLLINWTETLLRYNLRPRYFIYNKNSTYLRNQSLETVDLFKESNYEEKDKQKAPTYRFTDAERLKIDTLITDPKKNISYMANKKEGLSVFINEVQ